MQTAKLFFFSFFSKKYFPLEGADERKKRKFFIFFPQKTRPGEQQRLGLEMILWSR